VKELHKASGAHRFLKTKLACKTEYTGAGHFFDLASHQFDYLDFFWSLTAVKAKPKYCRILRS
jgi:hypothetical protein